MTPQHIVKVCGLREPHNVLNISQLPVDWLGLVFHPASPRHVAPEPQLEAALRQCPQLKVGVFVEQTPTAIAATARHWQLDMVQLHGAQTPAFCATLRALLPEVPLIKAFRIGSTFDFREVQPFSNFCRYVLFDTKGDTMGGTGRRFDWQLLDAYRAGPPFLLSGGIGPEAVEDIQAFTHPLFMGIDLNSRFEQRPALKDVGLLRDFLFRLGKHQLA